MIRGRGSLNCDWDEYLQLNTWAAGQERLILSEDVYCEEF